MEDSFIHSMVNPVNNNLSKVDLTLGYNGAAQLPLQKAKQ